MTRLMNAGSCSTHSDYSRRWVCSLLHVYGVTSYIYPLIIKKPILIPLILTSLSCFVSNNFPVHIPIRLEASTMSLFPPQQIGGTCSFPIYLLVKYSCIFLWLRGRAPFSEKVDRAVKIGQQDLTLTNTTGTTQEPAKK